MTDAAESTEGLKSDAARAVAGGDSRRALELYRALEAREPTELRWSLKAAEMAVALGDANGAVKLLREAGAALAQRGQQLKAAAACRAALQIAPRDKATLELLMGLVSSLDDEDEDDEEATPRGESMDAAPDVILEPGERISLDQIDVGRALPAGSATNVAGIVEFDIGPAPRAVDPGYTDLTLDESVFEEPVAKVAPRKPAATPAPAPTPAPRASAPPVVVPRPATMPPVDPTKLRGIPLLGMLPPDAVEAFAARSEFMNVAPGDRVISEGDPADRVYLVVSGDLVATRGTPPRILARLGEGAFFGEMALLDDTPRSATVVAVTDVELLVLPRRLVLEMCERFPTVLASLMQSLRTRLIATLTNASPLFATLPYAERARIVARFRLREVDPGTDFIREGYRVDGLYVLLTGRADVLVNDKVLASLTTGDVAGEMSLLSHGPAQATVRARTRVSTLVLPANEVPEVMMVHPQVLDHLATLSESRREALDLARGRAVAPRTLRRV